jgi:hypothetical protein
MKESKTDLFDYILDPESDAICITTNGNYTINGLAIMGGGCAGAAAKLWTDLPKRLGKMLVTFKSNVPYIIGAVDKQAKALELTQDLVNNKQFKCLIFSFPTINNLMDGANINLIKQSATIMVDYANQYNLKKIILPRPGTGIGGLSWADVKIEIENILDDRFIIVSFEHEE